MLNNKLSFGKKLLVGTKLTIGIRALSWIHHCADRRDLRPVRVTHKANRVSVRESMMRLIHSFIILLSAFALLPGYIFRPWCQAPSPTTSTHHHKTHYPPLNPLHRKSRAYITRTHLIQGL